jgi:hypothetical protein
MGHPRLGEPFRMVTRHGMAKRQRAPFLAQAANRFRPRGAV